MLIYIAGALSNSGEDIERSNSKVVTDYIKNIHKMCQVATAVRKAGHFPYVPGLDLLLGLSCGIFEEEDYRGIGMAFLEVCDLILVISDSTGVRREVAKAEELGIPVEYLNKGANVAKVLRPRIQS